MKFFSVDRKSTKLCISVCGVRIFVWYYLFIYLSVYLYHRYKNKRIAKTVCYTYQSIGYDNLVQHKYICKNWDYVCFTDNPKLLKYKFVGIWKIEKSRCSDFDSKRNSGWHKTHPHELFPNYENSVWVDGNIDIKSDYLNKLIKERNGKILTPLHHVRNCIYDEIDVVCQYGYETKDMCNLVKNFFEEEGMPKKIGLNETNIMYREHNDRLIKKIDCMWWKMIEKYSKRDQLSFSYVLWKNGVRIEDISIPNARVDSKNYSVYSHKKHHC